ncbi:YigZ family protein [Sporosarcina sp. P21c]|uniref:YigZ family protein n=1 Tax=Sporosarcina TaxID=1569 RepID=UPI000A156A0D|nr:MULTISPECIES: YigZ family protein [Sporosarcina]ARJ39755.1 YigZ family protein [Sporosarcina ureae]PIC65868.1 YigZ family protein [Sporosarcina sp. P16a]PIC81739.1 YigZ family protein [Sporosarcina sp. P1]PIC88265.1 YigZ family protein [Sporosarcina sp. P21c]PIC94463.1 YigZ family protein [Sporosarcina sp. P25]
MRANYKTVKLHGESEFVIQKSRFLSFVKRVETEQEALDFIQDIKKNHHTATHNCSAYIIGEHDQIQKANDDGEPSGTAGFPILEVLKKQHLKDTVIVVTRYYGGIKLGGGGLIRAYGKAASEGIAATGIVERKLHTLVKTSIDYTWLGKVENEIRQSDYPLKEIVYEEDVELFLYVPEEQQEIFQEWMMELTNGQAIIATAGHKFLEFDI